MSGLHAGVGLGGTLSAMPRWGGGLWEREAVG